MHGSARVGDKVDIIFPDGTRRTTVITRIEMFKKLLDYTTAGDNVGIALRGVKKDELFSAIGLVNAGTEILHKRFKADMTVLTREEGKKNTPIFDHYSPWIALAYAPSPVRGMIDFDRNGEKSKSNVAYSKSGDMYMLMPGFSGRVVIELDSPALVVPGFEFTVLEGSSVKTVKGKVIEVLD